MLSQLICFSDWPDRCLLWVTNNGISIFTPSNLHSHIDIRYLLTLAFGLADSWLTDAIMIWMHFSLARAKYCNNSGQEVNFNHQITTTTIVGSMGLYALYFVGQQPPPISFLLPQCANSLPQCCNAGSRVFRNKKTKQKNMYNFDKLPPATTTICTF